MLGKRLCEYTKFLKSLMLTNGRLLKGMWTLTKLPQPAITFFGGSRITQDSEHAKKATALAEKLTAKGFSIITGGGAGIMEAANLGAYKTVSRLKDEKKLKRIRMSSMGIGLLNLGKNGEEKNPYVHDYITMYHFFSRKWLLVRSSIGFIVFPGGFGTMDELFEVITLMQCNRMPAMPLVLMGKDYWQPIVNWATEKALEKKFINKKELEIIHLTDDIDDACKYVIERCKICKKAQPFYVE